MPEELDKPSKTRECPLCSGSMRLHESETLTQIPGNPKPTKHVTREWRCPDCDYFEDADVET